MPKSFRSEPLMYQGGSDAFLGPCDDIQLESEDWGLDLEAEIAVITGDVPMGIPKKEAGEHIRLLLLVERPVAAQSGAGGTRQRIRILPEQAQFRFFPGGADAGRTRFRLGRKQAEPAAAGAGQRRGIWVTQRRRRHERSNFPRLIAHAAGTRPLSAGTIVGSGTVSNAEPSAGTACIAEKRALEVIAGGEPVTPFLKFGDRVRIEMFDAEGNSLFGAIEQQVARYTPPR